MTEEKTDQQDLPPAREEAKASGRERITPDEFVFFNRQLASLVRLDLPFRGGLAAMAREANTPEFRRVSEAVAADLEQGIPLADALAKFPRIFSRFYLGAVRAGQESGNLAGSLDALAQHSRSAYRWRRLIGGAMLYPLFAGTILLLLLFFILVCIVPKFVPVFDSLGVPLPLPTRLLIAVSLFLRDNGILIFTSLLAAIVVLVLIARRFGPAVAHTRFVVNLPVVGSLARKSGLQLFCQMLLALLRGGMSLAPALDLISQSFGRNIFGKTIGDLRDAAAEGEGIGEQCKKCGLFPQSMAWKIAVTEPRGALEEALEDLSSDLSVDVEIATQNLARIIFPVLVFFLGLIVLVVVGSVFLPIFKIQQVLTG